MAKMLDSSSRRAEFEVNDFEDTIKNQFEMDPEDFFEALEMYKKMSDEAKIRFKRKYLL